MTVHVDEIETQVQVEGEPARESSAGGAPQWKLEAEMRAMLSALRTEDVRTKAQDFDD